MGSVGKSERSEMNKNGLDRASAPAYQQNTCSCVMTHTTSVFLTALSFLSFLLRLNS